MIFKFKTEQTGKIWRHLKILIVVLGLISFNLNGPIHLIYAQDTGCSDRSANELSTQPTSIWVEIKTFYEDFDQDQPFTRSFSVDDYISGVLLGELGASPDNIIDANLPSNDNVWEDITLEAMAVAIRTFTWFRMNYAGQLVDPHYITLDDTNECGFWDYEKDTSGRQISAQVFRPRHQEISQIIKDHYTAIVTQHVPGIYLVEGEGTNPIDAQYRATVGEYSDPGGKPYLISIFDPISAGDPDPNNASGLGQWGA